VNDSDYTRRKMLGLLGAATAAGVTAGVSAPASAASRTTRRPSTTKRPTTTRPAATVAPQPSGAAPTGTLKIGGGWVFLTWNAHDLLRVGTGPIIYWRPVYDTLLNMDANFQIRPGLATKWTHDEKGLTMTLRSDVSFTDGTPLTPKVVVDNLNNIFKDPRTAQIRAMISSIETVGNDRVRVSTNSPVPNLAREFATSRGMMIAPAVLGSPKLADGPVGSGPYIFDAGASVPGQRLSYRLNPKYWNPAAQTVEKLEISVLADPGARLNALLSGQVDVTYFDNALSGQAIKAGFKSAATPGSQYSVFIFDRKGETHPAFASKDVRQALGFAIDRAAFAAATLPGIGRPTVQPFEQGQGGYDKSLDTLYDFDRARARQLLARAGYPDGFSFDMPITQAFQQPIEVLAQQWREIGVRVRLVPLDISQYGPQGTSGKFPVLFVPIVGRFVYDSMLSLLSPRGSLNPLRITDGAAVAALDELERAFDEDKVAFLGARCVRIAMENAVFHTFAIGDKHAFYKDGVTGVVWNVDEPGINPIGIKPKS
jgi:peptide/nickel transport system substrate-binding protein